MGAGESVADIRDRLGAAFADRLNAFYRALRITPPYHSVEKAKLALRERLGSLPSSELDALVADEAAAGRLFGDIMRESGLAKKQRGIIQALLASNPERLPSECRPLAEAYRR